jgi:hypothetical protein
MIYKKLASFSQSPSSAFGLVGLLLTGCISTSQAPLKVSSSPKSASPVAKVAPAVPPAKALILATSDEADVAPPFYQSLVDRLNQGDHFRAQLDSQLTQEWKQSTSQPVRKNSVDSTISALADKVKKVFEEGEISEAMPVAQRALSDARALLVQRPGLAPSFAELLFWSSVSFYDSPEILAQVAPLYVDLAPKKLVLQLETKVSPKVIRKIYAVAQPALKQKVKLKIYAPQGCDRYVNGERVSGDSVDLPLGVSATTGVQCSLEAGGKTVLMNQSQVVKLDSLNHKVALKDQPPLATLPMQKIEKLNPKYVIAIHFNSEKSFLKAVVLSAPKYDSTNFKYFDLASIAQRDRIGDDLIQYFNTFQAGSPK